MNTAGLLRKVKQLQIQIKGNDHSSMPIIIDSIARPAPHPTRLIIWFPDSNTTIFIGSADGYWLGNENQSVNTPVDVEANFKR